MNTSPNFIKFSILLALFLGFSFETQALTFSYRPISLSRVKAPNERYLEVRRLAQPNENVREYMIEGNSAKLRSLKIEDIATNPLLQIIAKDSTNTEAVILATDGTIHRAADAMYETGTTMPLFKKKFPEWNDILVNENGTIIVLVKKSETSTSAEYQIDSATIISRTDNVNREEFIEMKGLIEHYMGIRKEPNARYDDRWEGDRLGLGGTPSITRVEGMEAHNIDGYIPVFTATSYAIGKSPWNKTN